MLLILLSASLLLLADARATTTKPCLAKCPANHRCEWKAIPDSDCYNPPCGTQPSCVPTVPTLTCANTLCNVGYKCIETPSGPKCIATENCAANGCPDGFRCDTSILTAGTCVPFITCKTLTCNSDSICVASPGEDAVCLPVDPITCATILCAPGFICVDEPSGGKCKPRPSCRDMTCPRGQKCVTHTGNSATCQPVATCASTTCLIGSTCVDFPDRDAQCHTSPGNGYNGKCTAKCSAGQKCEFRPTPESECYNPPCADKPTCVPAYSDDTTSCETKECYAGYKCVVQGGLARCVFHRTCEELTCPSGQRCEEIREDARCVAIRTCQTLRCAAGQICSEETGLNAVCRPILTCSTLLCNSKQVCRAGNGREDAVCVDGVAANPCDSNTCTNGQTCQAINGKAQCVPTSQIATPSPISCNCRAGEKCVARAVVCVRAPCLPVLECRKARECSLNEIFTDCAGCEPSCANPNPICTLECRPARCVCRNGFLRDYSGLCVPERSCSRQPDVGIAHHLNNCESLRCPVASSCFDYGDRAECLYGPMRDDSRTLIATSPVRATIAPIRMTIPPKLTCKTVRCTADRYCVDTNKGPQCQEVRFTIGPIIAEQVLADNTRVTFPPRPLQSCAAVSCLVGQACVETKNGPVCETRRYTTGPVTPRQQLYDSTRFTVSPIRAAGCQTVKCSAGNQCVETNKGPVCEPTYYTIGPVTPRTYLYDNTRATVAPIRLTGCHTVKCSAGYECVETPRGGVCQPTKVKASCSTVLLNCVAGNACKDTPDGPRCLPQDAATCNCPSNQKCVAIQVNCFTTPCYPVLSCKPLTQCGTNEEWRECSSCDVMCSNPDVACPAVCGPPRCQCRNGFARDQTGVCVALKQCTKKPMGVKPATLCQYLRNKCTGNCYDYMDRSECFSSSNVAALQDFRPTFNCSHVNCPDQLGCIDTPRGPLCKVDKCAGLTCPTDLLCRDTREGPKCVPPFIYTDNVVDGSRHGFGGFTKNYNPPPTATCELVDCQSGHRCIDTPTGPICVPGVGGGSTTSCATTRCASNTRCQDTPIGPICVPLSGSNVTHNVNINCVCGTGQECVLVPQSCSIPPCIPKPECRPKTDSQYVKPSITCANVRCMGACVDTPTGPQCTPQSPKPTCASTSCLVGNMCIETPTGPRCVPSYTAGPTCTKQNEVLNGCGNHCEGLCEFVDEPRACTADCRPPACACATGFYRNAEGNCVTASECPAKQPVCLKPNEVVNECGNHCEGSCDFVDEPRICTADCRPPACACKSGFYRNAQGDCVPAGQCPPRTPVCVKANEIVGQCGNHCELSCRLVNQPQPCIEICSPPACMCKENFYRNDNGECVEANQCSTQNGYGDESPLPDNDDKYVSNLICTTNEEVRQCGNLCEAKCEHIGKGPAACVKICNPPACACKEGFFRDNKGKCVAPNACPNSSTYMGGKGGDGRIPYRH